MQYPDSIPIEEVKSILAIAKSQAFKERFQEFMHCAWVVQGYAQAQLIGAPDVIKSSSGDPEAMLEALVAQCESGDASSQALTDWKAIIPYVLKLILLAIEMA